MAHRQTRVRQLAGWAASEFEQGLDELLHRPRVLEGRVDALFASRGKRPLGYLQPRAQLVRKQGHEVLRLRVGARHPCELVH